MGGVQLEQVSGSAKHRALSRVPTECRPLVCACAMHLVKGCLVVLAASVLVVVPTRNPGRLWPRWLELFQGVRPSVPSLVVDSSSNDGSDFSDLPAGMNFLQIPVADFNHGATRNLTLAYAPRGTEVVVFLTQDALMEQPESLAKLVGAFADPDVACAFGRQLPHTDATPPAAHSRLFNYPAESRVVSFADRSRLGVKTCFLSNSFAAYRLSDLMAVGGFPPNVILGEDMAVAGRLLMAGKRIAYRADACVFHSHNYSCGEEFRRYFDTGVFHAQNPWLLAAFGSAGGEGLRYVVSELRYLGRHAPLWLPVAVLNTAAKWLGYKLGRWEAHLPMWFKRRCSMHKGFWRAAQGGGNRVGIQL